jgi:tetratricopeptide (TPR) repeat protein
LQSPLASKLIGHTVQEKSGLRFEYSPSAKGIQVTVVRSGRSASAVLEWAFGAGVRGITPVGSIDGGYFEHRVSWYTEGDRTGLTMGHGAAAPADMQAALGQKQPADVIARCFDCHATDAKGDMRPGIECERCHGPGAAHAQAPTVRNIQNPGRLTSQGLVQFCGQCHRLPPSPVDPHETIRFAPIGLMASRCFRQSDHLSCLTCHDAHADVNQDASYYTGKCVGCHAKTTPAVNCRRAARDNCLPCHMPKANIAPYLTFTDHDIRVSHLLASQVYETLQDPAKAVEEAQAEIQNYPNNLAGYIQLGQIFLEYNTPQPAVEIYAKALELAPDSLPAHLGEGLALKGMQRFDEAVKELSLCFRRDPKMAVAFDALASLYLEATDYVKLAQLAQEYLQTNPSDYRGYYYLAAAREHAKDDRQTAESLLAKAIGLNPSFAASFALLGKLLIQDGRAADAARELERAIQLRPDYRPAHLYLGNAYQKLGREKDAAHEFQLVRELNEKENTKPSLRYHRGGQQPDAK